MNEVKTELKTEFTAMLNKKVVVLEACVEGKANKIRQDITSTLEELKVTMTAIRES